MTKPKEIWIKKGYEIYALNGFKALKIERLAKAVGISKSSFYHHFSDLECFFGILINHHYQKCAILAQKEKKCTSIIPELIEVLLEYKVDLLFHRQLRINRNDKIIEEALLKTDKMFGNYSAMLWVREINLKLNENQLNALSEIAIDDFYMHININNLNYQYLSSYFKNLSRISKLLV